MRYILLLVDIGVLQMMMLNVTLPPGVNALFLVLHMASVTMLFIVG